MANVASANPLRCLLRQGTGHPSVALVGDEQVLTEVNTRGAAHTEGRHESVAVALTATRAGVSCRD